MLWYTCRSTAAVEMWGSIVVKSESTPALRVPPACGFSAAAGAAGFASAGFAVAAAWAAGAAVAAGAAGRGRGRGGGGGRARGGGGGGWWAAGGVAGWVGGAAGVLAERPNRGLREGKAAGSGNDGSPPRSTAGVLSGTAHV